MSAPAKNNKPNSLKVVGADPAAASTVSAEPDTTALDQALTQFAAEQRPLIRRSDTARNRVAQRVREVESELADLGAQEAMLDRLFEAAKRGIADQREDLNAEFELYQHGLASTLNGDA